MRWGKKPPPLPPPVSRVAHADARAEESARLVLAALRDRGGVHWPILAMVALGNRRCHFRLRLRYLRSDRLRCPRPDRHSPSESAYRKGERYGVSCWARVGQARHLGESYPRQGRGLPQFSFLLTRQAVAPTNRPTIPRAPNSKAEADLDALNLQARVRHHGRQRKTRVATSVVSASRSETGQLFGSVIIRASSHRSGRWLHHRPHQFMSDAPIKTIVKALIAIPCIRKRIRRHRHRSRNVRTRPNSHHRGQPSRRVGITHSAAESNRGPAEFFDPRPRRDTGAAEDALPRSDAGSKFSHAFQTPPLGRGLGFPAGAFLKTTTTARLAVRGWGRPCGGDRWCRAAGKRRWQPWFLTASKAFCGPVHRRSADSKQSAKSLPRPAAARGGQELPASGPQRRCSPPLSFAPQFWPLILVFVRQAGLIPSGLRVVVLALSSLALSSLPARILATSSVLGGSSPPTGRASLSQLLGRQPAAIGPRPRTPVPAIRSRVLRRQGLARPRHACGRGPPPFSPCVGSISAGLRLLCGTQIAIWRPCRRAVSLHWRLLSRPPCFCLAGIRRAVGDQECLSQRVHRSLPLVVYAVAESHGRAIPAEPLQEAARPLLPGVAGTCENLGRASFLPRDSAAPAPRGSGAVANNRSESVQPPPKPTLRLNIPILQIRKSSASSCNLGAGGRSTFSRYPLMAAHSYANWLNVAFRIPLLTPP